MSAASISSIDYRRQARRLRFRYAHSPVRMYEELSALADLPSEAPLAQPTDGVRDFAAAVTRAIEGGVLRFSQRESLIRQAETLGIRRFDANLLIAACQNRLAEQPGRRSIRSVIPPHKTAQRLWLMPVTVAITLQSIICACGYVLLHTH